MKQTIILTFENNKKYTFREMGESVDVNGLLMVHLTDRYAAVKVKNKKVLTGIARFDEFAKEVPKENTYLIIDKEKNITKFLTNIKPVQSLCGGALINIEAQHNCYYLTAIDYHNNIWYISLKDALVQMSSDDIVSKFISDSSDAITAINKIACSFESSDFRCAESTIMTCGKSVINFYSRSPLCTQLMINQGDKVFHVFHNGIKPFINENNEIMTVFICQTAVLSTITIDFVVNQQHFRAVKKCDGKTDPNKSLNAVKSQFMRNKGVKTITNLIQKNDWEVVTLNYTKL